jgi:hypothetical protein
MIFTRTRSIAPPLHAGCPWVEVQWEVQVELESDGRGAGSITSTARGWVPLREPAAGQQQRGGEPLPFPSWNPRSILTEIYLCHACSCQERLSTETAGQGRATSGRSGRGGGLIEAPWLANSGHGASITVPVPLALGPGRGGGRSAWA